MTQQLARVIEAGIAEHPEDWHMLQRVFVTDLDPARLAPVINAASNAADAAIASNGIAPAPGSGP
jgi:KDO2-lipid IV(A) lauroyltransferase